MMKEPMMNVTGPAPRVQPATRGTFPPDGGKPVPVEAPQAGKPVPPPAPVELPELKLTQVVESLNNYLQSVSRDLQFSVDEVTGRTIVKVLDRESKEVIRQIPPETALSLAERLRSGTGLSGLGVAEEA